MRSEELWLVQENHATVKLDSSVPSRGMKTYSESRIELRNLQILKTMLDKSSVFVIRAALWAEKLGRCLEYCRSWKNTLGKLAVAVNLEAIRFEFWMKGALITVEICVLCGWWFSNQFEIVSETLFSCNTIGHELYWAILCSLMCPETDWNIRIGKQCYVFILTDFKKRFWCFIPDINQCVNNYFETEESWNLTNKLIL